MAPPLPDTPTCLTLDLATTPLAVTVRWKNGKRVDTVQVQRNIGAGWVTLATLAGSLNTYRDAAVSPGVTYTYRIVATNKHGTATSSQVAVTTPAAAPAPLVLGLPSVTPVQSPDGNPVVVAFTITPSGGTPPYAVIASPPSGSGFPVATTPVAVSVTDSSTPPLTAAGTFSVTVTPPPVVAPSPPPPPPPPVPSGSTLAYAGSFAVPNGTFGHVPSDEGASSFSRGPAYGLAFDPLGNNGAGSLFMSSKENLLNVAEISIPALLKGDPSTLNIATVLQGMADPAEGHLQDAAAGADGPVNRIGGLYVTGTSLIFNAYTFYDANNTQLLSHWTRNRNLSIPSARGPFAFAGATKGGVGAGFVNGYMARIPAAWQALLGGTALTGQSDLSIISRTSSGPGVFSFTPEALAADFPAQPLVYYPLAHQTLGGGTPSAPGALFNLADTIHGVVFPEGTSTVLFIGVHGLGAWHYGNGTSDIALDGVFNCLGDGEYCWYDPDRGAKGQHAYPYANFVWAYDANDLAAVKAGSKNPWDVVPTATGTLTLPYAGIFDIGGVAYDPVRNLVYVVEVQRQQIGCCTFLPVIHAFTVG